MRGKKSKGGIVMSTSALVASPIMLELLLAM
jgi:hypothetical protein